MAADVFFALVVEIVVILVFAVLGWAANARWQSHVSLRGVWGLIGGTVLITGIVVVLVTIDETCGRIRGTYAIIEQGSPVPTRLTPSPTQIYPTHVSPEPPSTLTPSRTATLVLSDTPTPAPTDTPAETPTPNPTETLTLTPFITPTETPTPTPSPTPTWTVSPTPTPTATPLVEMRWRDDDCDRPGQQCSITQVRVESGYLVIEGIANIVSFDRYALYWGAGEQLNKPVEERPGFESKTPVPPPGGELHRIRLYLLPPAEYRFTLRAVRQDGNYDTCEVGIIRR